MSNKSEEEIKEILLSSSYDVLDAFEKGKLSEHEFYDQMSEALFIDVDFERFETVWNSMLANIPREKLQLLKDLGHHHDVLILSNTNSIHVRAFDKMVMDITNGVHMEQLVDHAHYSHEMGMRKPDPKIYTSVIEKHNLDPSATVFFDDKRENIETALAVGLQGILVSHPEALWDHFE